MSLKKGKILVTGSAGFIGYHLTKKLLKKNYDVIGIDNLNSYYDKKLKLNRNKDLLNFSKKNNKKFSFFKIDIINRRAITKIFKKYKFVKVFHLAAQPGVRFSFKQPYKYVDTNIVGFFNILENCKNNGIKKLVFASSSSVYGSEKKIPYSEKTSKTFPIQLYAATKLSNEIIALTYSKLFKFQIIGLRFFTVYGPWGRPDMAMYKFMESIIKKKTIELYNNGKHYRDFTYVDDIVDGIIKAGNYISNKFEIFNLGNGRPITTLKFALLLTKILKVDTKFKFIKKQRGDMDKTYANINKAAKFLKFKNKIKIEKGILKFVNWYKQYNKIKK